MKQLVSRVKINLVLLQEEEENVAEETNDDADDINKLGQKLPPLKKRRLSKKSQKEKDEINRKLQKANKDGNYWRFKIHWNKLE